MTKLRRIEPMEFATSVRLDPGPEPVFAWVAPTDLWVDDTYQRELLQRSYRLISKIRTGFRWNKMKPPIAVREGDKLHLIDGQHTAIAAASLNIPKIPIFIVAAEAVAERAGSFVAHNSDRIKVAPFGIYKALLAAGDPEAVQCSVVCQRAGVRLRALSQHMTPEPGDCSALGAVQTMIKIHGPMRARIVLETLVKADRTPISADEIKAATRMLWINDPRVEPERLQAVIRVAGDAGLTRAQSAAKVRKTSVWRVLVDDWGRAIDAKKTAAA